MKFGIIDEELDEGVSHSDKLAAVESEGGAKRKASVLDALNVDVWLSTEIVRDDYVMHWNIEDIRNAGSPDAIKSPLVKAGRQFQHIWQVEVTPAEEIEGEKYLGVRVGLVAFANESEHDTGRQLKVSLEVHVVDKHEKICYGLEGTDYIGKGGTLGWPQFLKANDLEYVLQMNGDLRLLVGITIEMDTHLQGQSAEVTQVTSCQPPPLKKRCTSKVNDLETSKTTEIDEKSSEEPTQVWKLGDETPDFEIVTTEDGVDSRMKVQKSVLAAKNSYFKKHFESGPADQQESMYFGNVYPEGMKIILDFIYYGDLDEELIHLNPTYMFEYGTLFEVPEVKDCAEAVLVGSVCAENVFRLYWSAENFHGAKLLAKVIEFFKNHSDEVSPYDRILLEDELHLGDPPIIETLSFRHFQDPTDYEIVCSSVKFLVHKSVLAEKSSKLKQILNYGTLSQQTSLHMYCPDPEILKTVLQFMYTGKASEDDLEKCKQNPEEVLRLARRWELPEFKTLFEESLLHNYICAENVFQCYFVLGDIAPKLRVQASEYAQNHPAQFTTAVLKYFDDIHKRNSSGT